MKHRDRVLMALNHEQPDRCPMHISFTPEFASRLRLDMLKKEGAASSMARTAHALRGYIAGWGRKRPLPEIGRPRFECELESYGSGITNESPSVYP